MPSFRGNMMASRDPATVRDGKLLRDDCSPSRGTEFDLGGRASGS